MKETLSQRLNRERVERKLLSDAKEFAEKSNDSRAAQVTSAKRKAVLEKNVVKLDPIILPRAAHPPQAAEVKGTAIEFYVWNENQLGTMAIMTQSGFNPL